jgi:aspartate aminotransferase-like enzyme
MAEPIIHHRSPQFYAVVAEVEEGLKFLFQTKNEVLILVASGTGAMEGAVTNFLSALEMALKDLGYPVALGAGVKAAELVFSS